MTTRIDTERAEALGEQAAQMALDAGDPCTYGDLGAWRPTAEDMEWLDEQLGRKALEMERRFFGAGYCARAEEG